MISIKRYSFINGYYKIFENLRRALNGISFNLILRL